MKPRPSEHDCVGRFNDLVEQGKTSASADGAPTESPGACPGCGDAAGPALLLGRSLEELKGEIDQASRSEAPLITDDESARMLVRLAKLEAWHRLSRRACAASVGLAACLSLIIGLWLGFEPPRADQEDAGRLAPAQLAQRDDRQVEPDEPPSPSTPTTSELDAPGTLDGRELAFALPLSGWIDLPPEDASADLSVWWLVLNYGQTK